VARALTTEAGSQSGGVFDCANGPNRALDDAHAWLRRYSNGLAAEATLEGVTEEDIKLTFQRRCVATHPHRSKGDLEEYLQTHINLEVLRQWQMMDEWPVMPDEDISTQRCSNVLSDAELTKFVCGQPADLTAEAKAASSEELEKLNQKVNTQLLQLNWMKEKLEAEVSHAKSRGAYACIGVDPGASDAELARAYKAQALRLHPDRSGGSTEAFQALQAAYERILKQRGGESKKKKDDSGQTSSDCHEQAEDSDKRPQDKSADGPGQSAKQEAGDGLRPAEDSKPPSSDRKKQVDETEQPSSNSKKHAEVAKSASTDGVAEQSEDVASQDSGDCPKSTDSSKLPKSTEKKQTDSSELPKSTEKKQTDETKEPGSESKKQTDETKQPSSESKKRTDEAKQPSGESKKRTEASKERATDQVEDVEGFVEGLPKEGLPNREDLDSDLWDAERWERSVTSAAEAIPAEIVAAQADAVLHGAQMCCRASQLCSKAAAVGPMAWPQLQRMMTHLLEAAQHVAETCGRVGHHTTNVPSTVMPLLDAVTKQSSRLRSPLVRQVVKGTRGLLGIVDGLPDMAKEIILRQTVLVHHVAEVMNTMENLVGRQVHSSSVCTGIAEILETVARLAREAAETVAAAAMAVGETQRHAENLLEVLGAAGLWEKMDAEADGKKEGAKKSEGEKPPEDDESSDDEDKEPWEQNVELTSLLQSLNTEVLALQQELRDLVSQDPALISAVGPEQKEVLFSIVSELLAQARKRVSRTWYSKCRQHAGECKFLVAVEKPLEFLAAAASWKQIAVPSLEARLLRLAALVDSQLLCNMLETDLLQHTLGLTEADEEPQLQTRMATLSTKLRMGFRNGGEPPKASAGADGVR